MLKRLIRLLDPNKSILTTEEVERFRAQGTYPACHPIFKQPVFEVVCSGAELMCQDGFCLVKEQLDI